MREGENDGRRTDGGDDPQPIPDRRRERHRAGAAALLGPLTDMPPVVATACRVALVEATCFDPLKPFPKEGQKTVGAHVDLSHVAATPMACG